MAINQEVERASDPSIGQEVLNVPMGDMIRDMAFAIADAQLQLDTQAMRVAAMMSGAVFHPYTMAEKAAIQEAKEKGGKPEAQALKGTREQNEQGWFEDTRIQFGYKFSLDKDNEPVQEPAWVSMMELGFTPTFYQFVDTIIEVKITITITKSRSAASSESEYDAASSHAATVASSRGGSLRLRGLFSGRGARSSAWSSSSSSSNTRINASSVNGTYASKYGFEATAASLLRTKLKPIPPPAVFEDRVRQIMRLNAAYAAYTMKLDAIELMEQRTRQETKAELEERQERENLDAAGEGRTPVTLEKRPSETKAEFEDRKDAAKLVATAEFAEDLQE